MMDAREAIERGIAAAQANNQRTAYYYFYRATQADPNSEQAWLWRASAAPQPRDALFCLAAVLAINPDNPVARHGLEQISAAVAPTVVPGARPVAAARPVESLQSPEQPTAWQQTFQRELYDMARVPHMEPVDESPAPAAGVAVGAAADVGNAAYRRPVGAGTRTRQLIRRLVLDRDTQRVRFAVPVVIVVLLLIAAVALLGWRQIVNGPDETGAGGVATPTAPAVAAVGSVTPLSPTAPGAVAAGTTASPTPAPATATPAPATAPAPPPSATAPSTATALVLAATDTPAAPSPTPVPPTAAPPSPTRVPPSPTPAPAVPTATVPTLTPPAARAVVIGPGQDLVAVAQAQGVTLGALMAFNNLANIADAGPGSAVRIPAADYHPASLRYTLRFGETLSGIALQFGTTVDAITASSGIANPSQVQAGQTITIPLR